MKRSIQFLIVQSILVFFMVILTDWTQSTKFFLAFVWAMWSCVVAMSYAIISREDVDCRCFEKEKEE